VHLLPTTRCHTSSSNPLRWVWSVLLQASVDSMLESSHHHPTVTLPPRRGAVSSCSSCTASSRGCICP
jgi:hypothetical protein